jgi:hypothetical protein
MKQIIGLIIFLHIFSSFKMKNPIDPFVEIRLKLIRQINSDSTENIAVSISVINHTDNDIYIPCFDAGPYESGIHLYEKRNEEFKNAKFDLLGQQISETNISSDAIYFFHRKGISAQFHSNSLFERKVQDSILKVFGHKEKISISNWQRIGKRPLFLKAHQELDDFVVYDLWFIKQPSEYKICFEPIEIDPTYSPETILGYKRYDQGLIKSNAIYYKIISL